MNILKINKRKTKTINLNQKYRRTNIHKADEINLNQKITNIS